MLKPARLNLLLISALTVSTPLLASKTAKKKVMGTKKVSEVKKTVHNPQPGEIIVKCAGIVKKGMNHCGANGHKCSGLSADNPNIKDFDKNEWIYVRKEVCDATPGRIVGKKRVVKG